MRWLVLAALVAACAADPTEDTTFEYRVGFDRVDGSVVVNGKPFTERLVFNADSFEVAQRDIVLDVSVTTAVGTLAQQLRPGYCDLAANGTPRLESLGYEVIESTPPLLQVSWYLCEGSRGGAGGSP
ncbi:MAG TPA: hypothetical protein VFV99_00920 [Kofleriaceae bacterium]|nr:hypothetical protein [Kofleriaceae bacterium]